MGGYWMGAKRLSVRSRWAKPKKSLKEMTLWRLYLYDTLIEGLAQHLEEVAAELRPFIQKQHPVVRQRHLAWHWHLAASDQPHLGDGVMRGTTRARSDDGGAGAGAAGDARDESGVEALRR
jgi:hypothetical protein